MDLKRSLSEHKQETLSQRFDVEAGERKFMPAFTHDEVVEKWQKIPGNLKGHPSSSSAEDEDPAASFNIHILLRPLIITISILVPFAQWIFFVVCLFWVVYQATDGPAAAAGCWTLPQFPRYSVELECKRIADWKFLNIFFGILLAIIDMYIFVLIITVLPRLRSWMAKRWAQPPAEEDVKAKLQTRHLNHDDSELKAKSSPRPQESHTEDEPPIPAENHEESDVHPSVPLLIGL